MPLVMCRTVAAKTILQMRQLHIENRQQDLVEGATFPWMQPAISTTFEVHRCLRCSHERHAHPTQGKISGKIIQKQCGLLILCGGKNYRSKKRPMILLML